MASNVKLSELPKSALGSVQGGEEVFALHEVLENIEKSRATGFVGHLHYSSVLSCRT